MVQFPEIPNSARFVFNMDLSEQTYRFRFDWNDREESWYMSVFDIDDTPRLLGKRVALTGDLFYPHVTGVPPGTLLAYDTSLQFATPGVDELGNRVVLLYFEPGEI